MTYNSEENSFVVILNVTPGKHLYRFIVDNEYKTDPNNPTCKDNQGYLHNMIQINENEAQLGNQQEEDYENEPDTDDLDEGSDEEYLIDDEKDYRQKRGIDIKKKNTESNMMEESPQQLPSFKVPKISHPEPLKIPLPTEHQFLAPQPVGLHAQSQSVQRSPPQTQTSSPQMSPKTLVCFFLYKHALTLIRALLKLAQLVHHLLFLLLLNSMSTSRTLSNSK